MDNSRNFLMGVYGIQNYQNFTEMTLNMIYIVNMYYMENYLTLHRKLDKYLMTLS